ncbi:MAG TPA: transglycosylase domain-containing protein [Allosphingosinicella sp.]
MADDYPSRSRQAYAMDDDTDWLDIPEPEDPHPTSAHRWPRWLSRSLKALLVLFALLVAWLTFTAPLNRSLQPLGAPSLVVLASNGETIARRGAVIEDAVDVRALPPHVAQAFIAVEDRRFFRHVGIDPYGLARAMTRNLSSGRMVEGGSTITQQLAKTSFTGADRTGTRKIQEAFIALWLEAWLSKEDILSRYLSNVYFGDNVYGLRAASQHYFSVPPEQLTIAQATMLAGVVNAPSRLAPTRNLEDARERGALVGRRMVEAGFISERERRAIRPARLRVAPRDRTPTGTYFADWVLAETGQVEDEETYGERRIQTTLDIDLQRLAERTIRGAGLGRAQAALVAMRTDGSVVAMVGGKNYAQNAFNRATQARRQSGSTFKLFTYLAALRRGYSPATPVADTPLTLGDWSPQNYGQNYAGTIPLAEAFARSSNVATVRLSQTVGLQEVIRAARDLGVTSPLPANPSLPLGTASTTLLEMTAAYAAVAADGYPVVPNGLAERASSEGWFGNWYSNDQPNLQRDRAFAPMRELLSGVVQRGTGTAANLSVPTFGKTGTTQDYRDALFIGFAGDLVVGVWIGNDDNRPLPGITGGALPARIWRSFMTGALDVSAAAPAPTPEAAPPPEELGNVIDPNANSFLGPDGLPIQVEPFGPNAPQPQPGDQQPGTPPAGPLPSTPPTTQPRPPEDRSTGDRPVEQPRPTGR